MSTQPTQDFRCSNRIGVRTPVVIYDFQPSGALVRARAWTDDLSVSGVKLVTENRLVSSQPFVRIMLPELKDRIIHCRVIREDHSVLKKLKNSLADVTRWCYGVQFVGLADETTISAVTEADNKALGRKPASV